MAAFFELLHQSKISQARLGRLHTQHGTIETPCFVAVGTHGTLKGIDNQMVNSMQLPLMFCNTYHLMLQPGTKVIEQAGGLHRFIKRNGAIITDSGGFQIFSLAYGCVADELKSQGQKKANRSLIRISEEGALFRSYRDGTKRLLTPENSIQAQKQLGADIIIPLDELPPFHIQKEQLVASFERTHRWQLRSLQEHRQNPQGQYIFAVVHGGLDLTLRKKSIALLQSQPFDGLAIGGSLGKSRHDLLSLLAAIHSALSPKLPRHLLGIADPSSIAAALRFGIDSFDSCYPTRAARHGLLFTNNRPIKLAKTSLANCHQPIEALCNCYTCKHFHLSYLHHLFKAREFICQSLCSIHNVHFMVEFMKQLREQIGQDQI